MHRIRFAINKGLRIIVLEVILIIIGVYMALAVNEWNSNRHHRARADEALANIERFETDKKYVAVCPIGLKSAHLAMTLRQSGRQAHNFRGGFAALLRDLVLLLPGGGSQRQTGAVGVGVSVGLVTRLLLPLQAELGLGRLGTP